MKYFFWWFGTIFIIIILIGGFIYVHDELDNISLQEQSKCQQDGSKFFSSYKEEKDTLGDFWDEPEFYFDKKRNTCLIYTKYFFMFSGLTEVYEEVANVYTSEPIIYGYYQLEGITGKETLNIAPDTFAPNYVGTDFDTHKELIFSGKE